MSENRAAYDANTPAAYDRRRFVGGVELDPLPGTNFRLETTLGILEWCWAARPELGRAVLDVAAGQGNLGWWARSHDWPACRYDATEQSERQIAAIRDHVPDAGVAEWRCDPGEAGGESLQHALETAPDTFLRAYPVVLLSHGPEHHADAYHALDECWSMVAPGGFLVLVAARHDAHRSHYRQYDWDDLLALAAHYAGLRQPLVVWEIDYWADLYVAIPKPAPPAQPTAPLTKEEL